MSTWEFITSTFSQAQETYMGFMKSTFQSFSWQNPLQAVMIIGLVCLFLEAFLPKKINYSLTGRKGFFQDLVYVLFIDFLIWPMGLFALLSVVEAFFLKGMAAMGFEKPQIAYIGELPTLAQFIIIFLIVDFTQWLGHYLLHRVPFLWEFHKIHHAQEDLGFASTRHFHWVEFFVFKSLLYIPFGLIGWTAENYFVFQIWFGLGLTFLSHCNIKLNWGILNHILITPDTHFWHHAKNVELKGKHKHGVNFASVLCIWDKLFGFFHLPEKAKPELGIHKSDVPKGFIQQQIYPFKRMFRRRT